MEYCGEVVSSEEAKKRSQAYEAHELKDAYIISLHANHFIDAIRKGRLARFINHSCGPNCETRKWIVLGETRVGIFAKQDISVGTELAYNYNLSGMGVQLFVVCVELQTILYFWVPSLKDSRSTAMSRKMEMTGCSDPQMTSPLIEEEAEDVEQQAVEISWLSMEIKDF